MLVIVGTAVMALILVVGGIYWALWIRPFDGLHARATVLVAGTPAVLVSREDGIAANENISPLQAPLSIVSYRIDESPKLVCEAISDNLVRDYGQFAINYPDGLPSVRGSAPAPRDDTCSGGVKWPGGQMMFVVHAGSGETTVGATFASGGVTARGNVVG